MTAEDSNTKYGLSPEGSAKLAIILEENPEPQPNPGLTQTLESLFGPDEREPSELLRQAVSSSADC